MLLWKFSGSGQILLLLRKFLFAVKVSVCCGSSFVQSLDRDDIVFTVLFTQQPKISN